MTTTRHRALPLVSALSSVLALLPAAALTAPAAAQAERPVIEGSYLAVVTADDVYVRSGAADSYYPFGRVRRGDVVRVVGSKHDWARVRTEGPTFREFFGYIRYPRSDTGRFQLRPEGDRGRTLGLTRLLAPNLNTGYEPNDSWMRILMLDADRELIVRETLETDRTIVHKVTLPPDAAGWISRSFLEPATTGQIAAWEAAVAAAEASGAAAPEPPPAGAVPGARFDASVLAREEPVLPPIVVPDALATLDEAMEEPVGDAVTPADFPLPPSGTPAFVTSDADPAFGTTPALRIVPALEGADERLPARVMGPPVDAGGARPDALEPEPSGEIAPPASTKTLEARLEDLEAAHVRLREEPIMTAEVRPLRALYEALADDAADDAAVLHMASARAEQLAIWAALQDQRAELGRLRKRLQVTAEETAAVRRALDTTGLYVAVGRLSASTIYDGRRLPRLFRIQDINTGRTVAYLRPGPGLDLGAMVGQVVGVIGEKRYEGTLRVNLVEPRQIDLLGQRTG